MRGIFLVSVLPLVLLSACGYHPAKDMPEPMTLADYPVALVADIQQVDELESAWWQQLGSSRLNQYMLELQQQNHDLTIARLRIQRAQALWRQGRADNYPDINLRVSNRNSRDLDNDLSSQSDGLSLSSYYGVDLWGARAASISAAGLSVALEHARLRDTNLRLQAQLATAYLRFVALHEQSSIAADNLAAAEGLLRLVQLRFEAGSASGIEVDQQRNTLLAVQRQQQQINRDLALSRRGLAVILGRDDFAIAAHEERLAQLTLPAVKVVQPLQLLQRRPDIALAEASLLRSHAQLHQTRSLRWPVLSLSAELSLNDLSNLHQQWSAALVESLTAPLFNAGRIKQQIRSAEQDLAIDQSAFQQAVLLAMQDSHNALTNLAYQRASYDLRQQELSNSEKLYHLALARFKAGDTDFLNLLNAQRSLFAAREANVLTLLASFEAVINVRVAMGNLPEVE